MDWKDKLPGLKRRLEKRYIPRIKKGEERLLNIPNPITFLRIFITFLIIYLFIIGAGLGWIILLFVFGMMTDFFDGYLARKLDQETEFGRQFDMLADRFLFLSTAIGIIAYLHSAHLLSHYHLLQIALLLSREIVASPFALISLFRGMKAPHVRFIGKLTTFMQGVAFPCVILSIYIPFFSFSIFLSILTGIIGVFSALYYIRDLKFKN